MRISDATLGKLLQKAATVKADDLVALCAEDSPITKIVGVLFEDAIKADASSIHIEPQADTVHVRYRIDGLLHEATKIPRAVLPALVARIKILGHLKSDEHRVPQDGRIKASIGKKSFALHIATLPVNDGEKVVVRIFVDHGDTPTLEQLGFWGGSLQSVTTAIQQPHGLILTTGPAGSGTSTSLYSMVSLLCAPTVNVSTIEDPIEHRLTGASQTQVNIRAGLTFASGLRALLRQDPNVIMVGDIHDTETASLSAQAAVTGHMVLGALHTPNAATALSRLVNMQVEPFLVASTVRATIGQRLVRRLCAACKIQHKPDSSEVKALVGAFNVKGGLSHISELEAQAVSAGISKDAGNKTSLQGKSITRLWRPNPKGCNDCNHSGYKGRLGIFEVLPVNENIQKLVFAGASAQLIQDEAIRDGGMVPMHIDGLVKALRGQTSIEELLRAVRS